ncbi:unnamed protein product, partial [Didymodactylos carnosus]
LVPVEKVVGVFRTGNPTESGGRNTPEHKGNDRNDDGIQRNRSVPAAGTIDLGWNIFLKSDQIKIGDFGISRILVGTMDQATTFTGTPYFMSPEVMKHDGYTSKSDIWSVGCLLYEMCTFQHAFDGKGLMNVIYKVVEGKPPELPTTYSKELNDVLKK